MTAEVAVAEIPIPTVSEVGQGVGWVSQNANQGTVAVLAVACVVLMAAIVAVIWYFGSQVRDAWARVTAISEARSADSKAGDATLAANTLAMTILSERLKK